MQCLLLSSKNTHWISLNDSNTGLLPWQQAKKLCSEMWKFESCRPNTLTRLTFFGCFNLILFINASICHSSNFLGICCAGNFRQFPLEFTAWTILVPTLNYIPAIPDQSVVRYTDMHIKTGPVLVPQEKG